MSGHNKWSKIKNKKAGTDAAKSKIFSKMARLIATASKQVKGDKGEFTAIFDGTHGWFWRNRSNRDVTITLKTKGEYLSVKRVI